MVTASRLERRRVSVELGELELQSYRKREG